MEIGNSVQNGCDVRAEKRRKVLGGKTKDGYVRIPGRTWQGDLSGESLWEKVKLLC